MFVPFYHLKHLFLCHASRITHHASRITLLILCILGSMGCRKTQELDFLQSSKLKLPRPYGNNLKSMPLLPTVSNGLLCFSDSTHIENFLDYLDALSFSGNAHETDSLQFDSTSFDERLDVVEQILGFESLRKKQAIAFEALNEIGFASIKDLPKEDFIIESALRTVLNQHREVKVGTSVFVWYNEDYVIEIEHATQEDLEKILTYVALNGYTNVPPFIFTKQNFSLHPTGSYDYDLRPSWQDTTVRPPRPPKAANGVEYFLSVEGGTPDCSALMYSLRMVILGVDSANPSLTQVYNPSVRYEINWGDGSPLDIFTASTGGLLVRRTKNYSGGGTYTVRVYAYNNQTNMLIDSTRPRVIQVYSFVQGCSRRQQFLDSILYFSGQEQFVYIHTILDFSIRTGWMSSYVKLVARSKSYIREAGASNFQHKAIDRMSLQCYFKLRRLDDCNYIAYDRIFADWPRNVKTVEISKKANDYNTYKTGEIKSIHQAKHDDVFTVCTHILKSCD